MVVCVCVYWANSPLSHDYDDCVELDVVEGGREEDLERHFVGPKKLNFRWQICLYKNKNRKEKDLTFNLLVN